MFSEDEPLKFRSDRSAVVLLLGTTASADRFVVAPGDEGSPVYLRSHSNEVSWLTLWKSLRKKVPNNPIAILCQPLLPVLRQPLVLSQHRPPGPELLEPAFKELPWFLADFDPGLKLRPGQGKRQVGGFWFTSPIQLFTQLCSEQAVTKLPEFVFLG